MKHCYFALVYNELPYLTEKMEFLYRNFDQLIFYDLGVLTLPYENSNDWSLETLQDYPDPGEKITVLSSPDLTHIPVIPGKELAAKRQMSVACSKLVRDDIDVVWTMDIDEFFDGPLMLEVENLLTENPDVQVVDIPQIIFWKNTNLILRTKDSETCPNELRVARHVPGRIYLHCNMEQIGTIGKVTENCMYHFSWIDEERYRFKTGLHNQGNPDIKKHHEWYLKEVWKKVNTLQIKGDQIYGIPDMHPNPFLQGFGIQRFQWKLPGYINKERMMKQIEEKMK
jgi:hypothetical protein